MAARMGTVFRMLLLLGSLIHLANGAPPTFGSPFWSDVLPEVNTTAGTIITRLTATGGNGTITYSLEDIAHPWFRINSSTGDLIVNKTLDREAMGNGLGSLRFEVYASDSSSQGSLTAILTITDINDNAPAFQNTPLTVSCSENRPIGLTVATLTATDADATTNAIITFVIVSGNEGEAFSIDKVTGDITISKPLDYDKGPRVYTLNISAMNNHTDLMLQSFGVVTINITDVDDLPANFSQKLYEAHIDKNSPLGSLITQVHAKDMDSLNAPVEYSIYPDSDPGGLFAINKTSGEVTVDGNLRNGVYSLIVNAKSTTQPLAFTLVKVTVSTLSNLTYDVSILEGEANVPVMDLKPAESHFNVSGGNFTFFDSSGSMFSINGTNLRVGSTPLDRETAAQHILDISLTEGGTIKGFVKVTVNVLDINDETPLFQSPSFNVSVNEIERLGTVFLTVSATDGDAGANSALTYSIAVGNEEGFFSINNKTGAISVAKQLDRETRDQYTLTVMAQDGGEPPLNSTTAVAIQVGDANDNPPVIQDAVIQVSLSETAEIDTPVATVIASDKDIGANGRLMYSIESGALGHFQIKDWSSGAISLAGMLSYNQRNNYIVVVNVTDGGSPALKSRAIVVIDVTPKPRNLTHDVSVLEGEANVQVMDLKPAESHFNVSGGNFTFFDSSGSMFSINGTNLRVGSTPLDRETAAQHILDISLTEGGTIKGFVKVTVNVLDINDETPLFQSPSFNVSVNEIERLGTVFLTVSATDGDAGANSALTYSIAAGNEEGFFSINNKTGAISVAKQLDRETRDQYTLTVMAQDGGEPPLNSTTAVAIQVGDANDNPPVIQDAVIRVSLSETAEIDTPVATVIASDKDIGANGRLMYSIESGAHGHFQIKDSSSGAISLAGMLSYNQRNNYIVVVNVTDGGSPALKSRAMVVIDVKPKPRNLTYDVSVLEGEANVQVMDLKPAESHFNVSGGNFTFFDSSGSMFSINGTNLRVGSTPLDRETAAQHILDISLTEGGTIKGFVKVTVNVLDINDETPLFQSPSFNVSVNEIERLGTVFLTVSATDGDAGANSALTYSIAAGNEEGFFSINNKTGAISVAKQLDRETRDQYTLTVMAQDGGEPPLNSTTAVAIQVGDANDNPPVIQDAVIRVSLSETAEIDTPVATVIASDKDIGANGRLMYSIESGAHGHFQIKDSSSGAISLAGMLSYNQRNNYIVVVNVTDGGSPALKSRAMVVIDVKPKPRNLTYDVSVLEGEANVQVMDLKPAESHFNMSGGNFTFFDSSGSMFSINGTNLRVGSTPLDRETAAQHILDISLTEGGTIKGFVKVTVNVLDINDETPLFQSPSFNVSVNEIERLGTVFLTVSATDGDAGANSALTYSIAVGNEEGFFSINNKTGAISVAKQLDRETRDQYTLTVMAQDGGEPPLNSTTAVAIQVGDANDNPPVIQDAVIQVSLSETAEIDTPVATVIASDKDIGANGRLMYSIESGAHGHFRIKDSSSGAISLAGMLSYNQRNNYIVVVNVTDGGSPALKSRAMVVIDVTPKPRNLTYDVSVLEGEANVQVMDLKPAESHFNVSGGNFTFFDSSGSMFSINGTNLRVGSTPLDRETAAQHILDISLTEGGTIKGFVKVTVNVLDINDETPLFQSPSFNVSVNEIERLGTVFLTVSATDGDAGANSALTYSIAAGNEEGFFSINNKTGAISVAKQLDRETRDQYTLTVMAQDGGEPPLNSTTAVAIQVGDANDNPPVIQDAVIRVSLSETAEIDTPVATVIASDKDIGANGRLMYSIESGAHGHFQIKDSSSGAISLAGMLSYNQRNNYIVVVNVTDGGSPALKSRAMVVIDVTPKPRNLTYDVSVLEGEANVQVMDLKPAESHFNVSGGNFTFFDSSGSMFSINGTNLRVGSTPLDRETAAQHILDISLTEGGTIKGFVKVTVNVLDINDETPLFQSPSFNVSVNEIERLGTVFLTVSATDGDAGANSALTYSIAAGNEEGFFSINNKTGAISVAKQLDRETRDQYTLTVMAQDGGEPPLNSTTAVAIQVGDANDNPPVIQDAVIRVSLSETAEIDTPVATVIASDKDIGANGRLMYSIESGAHGHFQIKDSSSGAISLAGMLSYNQRNNYIVVVNVTDGGSPALKSRAMVVIDVTPKPRNLTYDVSVLEGEANVQVMDLKPAESHFNVSGGNFTFFDSSGSMFSINGTNLRVGSTPLDRETAAQHILDISLTEGGTIKGFVKVTVNVLDINDETPLFQSPSFNVSVNEIERLGTVFLTVSATDGDAGANSALTYSIAVGNEEGFFSINNKTGAISVAKQLDRETRDQYTLTVMAQDGGEPPLNSTTAVAIQVGDANDNPPVIQDAVIQVSLSETAEIDTPVATVIASDKDIGANGRLMYSIESGAHGHFRIKDSSSGAISLAGMLSYNQRNNYIVVVNVTDGGSPALKSRAMVVIDVTPKPRNLTYDVSVLEGEANVQVMDLKPAESHFNVSGGNFTFFDSSGSMFSINGTNLRVGSTPLDRETAAQHILDISLTEGGTIKGFVKVTVNVLDINDETPLFQSPSFNVSVNEIERLGTVFLTVSATDSDAGANSALTYSIAVGNEEGFFSINNKTGAISVAKQLDRETRDQYMLTVMAQDGGAPPLNSTTAVAIQVGDANDNPPVIQDAVIRVSLSETAEIDTPVATVIASDKDIGANGRLMYSIESGAHGHFQIKDSSSGAISLAGMLSYNQRNNYIVVVNVTDGGSPALKSRAMVVIDVTPKPRNLTYDVSVLEGEANVQVMDLKPAESHFNVSGGNFTFFDSSGSMFSINGTNLRVGSTPLDRETAAQHILDISLTEGGTIKGFVKVTVNVLDINDETPLFQSPSFNVSVNEIERLGTVFLTVSATDGDAGANSALTYSIAVGNEEGFFSINNKTGAISVAKQLDRETRDQYTLTVMAQDGGEPPLNSTTAVAIQVGDANDNPPVIQDAVIQVSLSETAEIDTPVATVIASDKDIGANGRLMYSIESGAHGHFRIKDSSSGAISLAGMLSYNQRNNYIVVVNVTDGGSPALKSRAMVVIDVTPKPRNLTYDVSVLEGEANVQVMDLKPAESHFNVSGGNFTFFDSSGSMFSINGTNLRVGSTPLDRETAAQHILDISLTEGGTIKGFVKVTVNVLDINDETPLFQSPSFNVSVNEIERLGTVFLTVSATDGDAGANSALTYSIAVGNEEGFFSINNKTGAISVAKQLDRETRDQYMLTVMAQDGGAPPLNSTTAVAIQVGDANDNPPVIQDAVIRVSLSETAAIDTPVATVIASDKDIGANGRLMYSIESGAHGHFQIKDSSSGAISLAGMLSYNQRNNYIVVVNVTDGGSPALKSRAMVVIDVTPKPRNLTYDVSVLEGEANVQVMDLKPVVSHFNVSGGNFTFFNSSGSMFSINGNNLRVGSTPLDRETAAQHVLDISLTEGGTIKGFVKVTVNVLDINDETPLFQSPSFNVSVNEIERLGTVFLTVSATDGDAGANSALTYSIAVGNEEGFFSINNKTGAISVAKQLDRETRDQYTLTVMAQDGGEPPLNSTTAVAIQVGDANDNPPVIQDAVIRVSLSETAAIDTPVATVIASDKDIGANGRLMYSIESGAHGHFQIKDSSSGAISLAGMLSYNQRNNYIVVVNVTDGGSPALKSRAMVVIDVTPKPRNLTYDVSVLEGEANVQVMDLKPVVSHFNVSGGNFTFFNSSGSMFSINGNNLSVGSTPLDRETAAQHVLDISLTEGGTIKGFVKVTVNVLDINDETPLFQSPSFNVSVNEIERLGTVFLTVSATDGDAGANSALTYSIAAGNEEGFFSINNKTGAISVAKQLDRETRDQYTLTVMAQDGGEPPLNSTTAVAIQVGDANDNPPVIQDAVIRVSLSETAAIDTPVATVIASDKDIGANGRLMYSIESGAHGHFQIKDSSSGAISLAGMLSYNQRNNYIVVVNVTDGGSPALKSRAMVVIDVTPKPRNLTYDVSVLEGEANVQVMDLKPVVSHFNVSGGNFTFFNSSGSMFSINGNNLRVGSTPLDRETAAQHVLDISLTEGGTIKGFVKVTVNVLDINDETPLFQSPSFNVSVNEIERLGTVFLTVSATDGDAGANSALTYSIAVGNEEGFFSINNKTGAISVAKQLDRETRDQYTLTVMAQDGGEPPLNSTTAVAIQVGDANDNPPVIQDAVIRVSLSETAAIDTPVATVIASDKDIGANGRLMYSIESGAHGHFQIKDSSSGAISLAGMLSYNQRNNYIVVVNVTDGGSPALKSRAMVVIDVTPKPRNLTYDVSVLEGEANVQVMDLKPAESHFNASGGTFAFFGSSGSMFSINGTNLRVGSTPLDRETAEEHVLDISLTEGGIVKGLFKVTVNVLDINDETPSFQSPSFNVSVNEIERLGTVFLTVSATDSDAGANSALTYSIAAGNEEGVFSINNKTAAISVAKQLDRETRDLYMLTVMAQDGGEPSLNRTAAVPIQVGDANDNPPVIQDAVIRVSLSETAAIDTPVATVIASDKDIGANGRLMYSIESGAHGHFQIKDSSSGAISVAGRLSYKQRNNYSVVVKVTDGGSLALESRAIVLIDVTPTTENRNAPVFASVQYIGGVYKDTSFDFPVLTVVATDSDTGINGVVEYRISEDTDLFYIEPTSGTIRTADIFADKDRGLSFSFMVQASDKGTPPKKTKENAHITIFLLRDSNSMVLTSKMSKEDILLRRSEFLEDVKELNGGGHVIIKSIRPGKGNTSIITINGIKDRQEMSYNQLFDGFKESEGSPKYVKWKLTGQGEPAMASKNEEELSPTVIVLIFLSVLVGVAGIVMILILCKKRRDERRSRVTFNDTPLCIGPMSSGGGGADSAQRLDAGVDNFEC